MSPWWVSLSRRLTGRSGRWSVKWTSRECNIWSLTPELWVFGKSVLVPAGAVSGIDATTQTVTVAFTKDEIKAAPRFTIDSETTQFAYLTEVGNYYAALLRAGAST